jgi:hypothetical protein
MAVIPGGLTKKLQPLDITVNLHPLAQAAELPPSLQKGAHLLSETRSGRQV